MYDGVLPRCWDLFEYLYCNGGRCDAGINLEDIRGRRFSEEEISVASRAFPNPDFNPDQHENCPRIVHFVEFGVEDVGTNKVDWKFSEYRQLPFKYGFLRVRLNVHGVRAMEWRITSITKRENGAQESPPTLRESALPLQSISHQELARRRALQATQNFMVELDRYAAEARDPRDRQLFLKRGIIHIQQARVVQDGFRYDLSQLRNAIVEQNKIALQGALHTLIRADHAVPFHVDRNFPGQYDELIRLTRDFVNISALCAGMPDGCPNGGVEGQAAQPASSAWLTVSDAANLLLRDVDGIDFGKAKSRVSEAAVRRFRTNGKKGKARRIDPDSYSRWRIEQRERNLDAYNEGH